MEQRDGRGAVAVIGGGVAGSGDAFGAAGTGSPTELGANGEVIIPVAIIIAEMKMSNPVSKLFDQFHQAIVFVFSNVCVTGIEC